MSDVAPMDEVVRQTVAQPRLYLTLFGFFAALALILAAVGLYSLVAYSVAQRTREFGIRSALGATPRVVLSLVLREGAVLIACGLALGMAGALASGRLLRSLLHEISATDSLALGASAVFLGVVTLLACYLPARRAMKVDPVTALRAE